MAEGTCPENLKNEPDDHHERTSTERPKFPAAEAARTNSMSTQLPSNLRDSQSLKPASAPWDFIGPSRWAPISIGDGLADLVPCKPRFVCSIATAKANHCWRERRRKRARHAENRRIILRLKAEGCWLCGDKTCEIYDLHFHHLGEKKGCIARLLTRSTEALLEEILGTRIICRRCHTEHHAVLESNSWKTGGCYEI